MKSLTINYPSDDLILRIFGFLYGAGLFFQLYGSHHLILSTLENHHGFHPLLFFTFLLASIVLSALAPPKWSWLWLVSTGLYFVLIRTFIEEHLGLHSHQHNSVLGTAMPFWVFLVMGFQKWVGSARTIFLIRFLLIFSYFSAGLIKIHYGFDWANGWTLQHYFLHRHVELDLGPGWWFASDLTRAKWASAAVLAMELLSPLAFLNRKLEWSFIALSFAFNILCFWLMKLSWMNYYGWSYLIYLAILLVYFLNKKGPALGKETDP